MIDSSINSFFCQENQQTTDAKKKKKVGGDRYKWPHHFASIGMLIPRQNRKLRLMPIMMHSLLSHTLEVGYRSGHHPKRQEAHLLFNWEVQRQVKLQIQTWRKISSLGPACGWLFTQLWGWVFVYQSEMPWLEIKEREDQVVSARSSCKSLALFWSLPF